jgi:cephalosporin-C deacetylase-like acetyl esterase
LESWFEAQYRSSSFPAPTRDGWKRLIAAEYSFLEPKPIFEHVRNTSDRSISLVSWPLMQVGSTPSTRGSQVARVRLFGFFHRWKQGGRRPAVITLAGSDALRWAGGNHVFELITAKREPFAQPWIEDRQWLDRLATQTGRTLLGADAAQVSEVAKFLETLDDVDPSRIAVAGGREAVAAAAVNPKLQLLATLDDEPDLWKLPQDLSLWKQARGFQWRDLTTLAPRLELTASHTSLFIYDWERAKAYNAMFAGWQAYFRNAALEAYAGRGGVLLEDYFEITGRYPKPEGSLNVQSLQVYDTSEVKGYRLSLRVYDGVHGVGILLVPKNLDLTRRHPMVFVQHGLGGRPEDALGVGQTMDQPVYRSFGLELARRGYIVFAPMISTQTVIGRNELVRRARPLGLTVAGMERTKFSRLIDFFETLPFVDAARIGFYGLSYGGYTALWTTPGEPRFRAVVCSGHFNDWSAKTTDLTMGTSYMYYADHLDMYNHGLLTKFSHAELAALLYPRPLLIEMGSEDGVMAAPRRLVDDEIARARARVVRFTGGHRIDGTQAFAFLDQHLKPQ